MVRINNNKKGQAAIEFLMTYGWMLLVVLIVGALIFSFVDFGSLLPNKALKPSKTNASRLVIKIIVTITLRNVAPQLRVIGMKNRKIAKGNASKRNGISIYLISKVRNVKSTIPIIGSNNKSEKIAEERSADGLNKSFID